MYESHTYASTDWTMCVVWAALLPFFHADSLQLIECTGIVVYQATKYTLYIYLSVFLFAAAKGRWRKCYNKRLEIRRHGCWSAVPYHIYAVYVNCNISSIVFRPKFHCLIIKWFSNFDEPAKDQHTATYNVRQATSLFCSRICTFITHNRTNPQPLVASTVLFSVTCIGLGE